MMINLEQIVQAVEHGLLKSKTSNAKKMELDRRMAYHKVPGFSLAIIDQGKIAWANAYGVMEAGGDKMVTPDTLFQAASISKPVSAMVALHLVEKGLLDLDSDVNEALRSWKVKENKYTQTHKVTLRGLLSHSAGLNVRGYLGYSAGVPLPSLQQILNGQPPANSMKVRVVQEPGTTFKYSGGGYVLLQQLIEDVTGESLAELAQEFILDKLGMANSTFEYPLPQAYIPQAAAAHRKNGEPVPGKWHRYPELAPAGLWSTPSDLACLISEVYKSYHSGSNRVLSTEMTRQMLTPQVGIGGLGFNIIQPQGRTIYGHPGWNEGFHSLMLGDLDSGQGLVWMSNGENGKVLGWEVMRGLAEIFDWLDLFTDK
jgi:CubicO group peptidase (beta-lactamase class C family)